MKCKTWIKELQGKVKVKIYHVDRWFELKVFFYERNKFVVSRMKIKFAWGMVKNGSLLANETILKVKISECGLTDEEWKLKFQDFEQQRGIGQIKNENCIVWIKSNLEDKESFEEKSDQMRIPWLCGGPCVAMMASQQSIPWAVWRPLCSHDGYTAIDSLGCVKAPV